MRFTNFLPLSSQVALATRKALHGVSSRGIIPDLILFVSNNLLRSRDKSDEVRRSADNTIRKIVLERRLPRQAPSINVVVLDTLNDIIEIRLKATESKGWMR